MKATVKQKAILTFLHKSGEITFIQVRELVDDYYCNGQKHTSQLLSRMVKSGMLIRKRKGVYAAGKGRESITNYTPPNQIEIF